MNEITMEMLPEAHRRIASIIGIEATILLCEAYGGAPLYIPKTDALKSRKRAKRIRDEYDGRNTAALSRRYGISRRAVQAIVSAR